MALMITLPTYCGRGFARVDYYDDTFATHSCCCNECVSIALCRMAFMDEYGDYIPDRPHITRISRTPDNDPWHVR